MFNINGDTCLSPGMRGMFMTVIPAFALVQFWFPIHIVFNILIAVFMLIICVAGISAHYVYQFDPDNKQFRKAKVVLGYFFFGNWSDLKLTCKSISFQKFSQEYTFHFLNLYDTHVDEEVLVLRLLNSDDSFEDLVQTPDFNVDTIKSMILLGTTLGNLYNLPFKDYVKGQVMKRKR